MVNFVQDHQGTACGGHSIVLVGVHGYLGVGDHNAVILRVDHAVSVGEMRVERQPSPCRSMGPLYFQVLGGYHDDHTVYGPVVFQLGSHSQRKSGFTGTWGRHRKEILGAVHQVFC